MSAMIPSSSNPYALFKLPSSVYGSERPGEELRGLPEFDEDSIDSVDKSLASCTNLTSIDFSQCEKVTNAAILTVLDSVSERRFALVSVNLKACPITDFAIAVLAAADCSKLKNLVLSNCASVTSEGVLDLLNKADWNQVEGVTEKQDCRELAHLDLVNCPSIKVEGAKQIIRAASNLSSLSFSGLVIDQEFMQTLEERHRTLTSLRLSGCNFTPTVWSKMPENLREVNFSGSSHITDTSIEVLAGRCRHLREINIRDCSIGNRSIVTLIAKCFNLACIDVERVVLADILTAAKSMRLEKKLDKKDVKRVKKVLANPSIFAKSSMVISIIESKPSKKKQSCIIL